MKVLMSALGQNPLEKAGNYRIVSVCLDAHNLPLLFQPSWRSGLAEEVPRLHFLQSRRLTTCRAGALCLFLSSTRWAFSGLSNHTYFQREVVVRTADAAAV